MTTDGQLPIPVSRLSGPLQPDGARLSELSTLELVSRLARTASRLVTREAELAKVEARADIAATVEMARRLAVAAAAGLVGVTMLLVALAFALTAWLPGWAAALIIAAVVLAVAAVAAMSGWSRRVRTPLARTRESVKEDLEWVKQRIA